VFLYALTCPSIDRIYQKHCILLVSIQ